MFWKLILNQQSGQLELWHGEELMARKSWEEKRNTSQEILKALRAIKEEQGMEWNQVPKFTMELDLPPHATARRIAETFERTYNTFVAKA